MAEVWLPARYTPSLTGTEQFVTDGDRLILLIERYWRMPDGTRLVLDDWQKWLLRHLLERYPDHWHDPRLAGRLRWRQTLVSLGRQNGKSLLGGILALYGLVQHSKGPSVVGLATSVIQASIVYDRIRFAVENNKPLSKRLLATGTRGIRRRDGSGGYQLKASKSEALQGVPITLGVVDELHILQAETWNAVVNGQRAQADALLIGITTAGDESSVLLKRLYSQADASVADPVGSRFGAFIWEAPEGSTIDTPGAIEAANPAVASGRIDVTTVRQDVADLPEQDQQRYTLNQFVTASSSWLPSHLWTDARGEGIPTGMRGLVFAFDRTPSWEYGSVAVAAKVDDVLHTELVASLVKPSQDQFLRLAAQLKRSHPDATFVMDTYALGALAKELKAKGYRVVNLSKGDVYQACALGYANLAKSRVKHSSDDLLTQQVPRAKRKNIGESWRIVRGAGADIDGLMSTLFALYIADTTQTKPVIQLFAS